MSDKPGNIRFSMTVEFELESDDPAMEWRCQELKEQFKAATAAYISEMERVVTLDDSTARDLGEVICCHLQDWVQLKRRCVARVARPRRDGEAR